MTRKDLFKGSGSHLIAVLSSDDQYDRWMTQNFFSKLKGSGWDVSLFINRRPITDFSAERNRVIGEAKSAGYQWLLFLDSDETMRIEDLRALSEYLKEQPKNSVFYMTRFDFVHDSETISIHKVPVLARLFGLELDFKFQNPVHEVPVFSSEAPQRHLYQIPIFHYVYLKLKDFNLKKSWHKKDEMAFFLGLVKRTEIDHPLRGLHVYH